MVSFLVFLLGVMAELAERSVSTSTLGKHETFLQELQKVVIKTM